MSSSFEGAVAPGFERVAETFSALRLGDGGAALCVLAGGEAVVDCWAGTAAPGRPWGPDTRGVLFSATKALTAATAMLVAGRGLLDVDAPVARYWPEFGAHGKEHVLVRHVLAHRAGVLSFPGYEELLDWDGRGWDAYGEIARRLADARPAWEPGTRHGYHALTYGWILGELVRRVDGRTLGTVLHDDIAAAVDADVRIGTTADQLADLARVHAAPVPTTGPAAHAWRAWQDPSTPGGQAFFAGSHGSLVSRAADFACSPAFLAAEVPAGNATGTARGIARVCGVLAAGGDGIWSRELIDEWRVEQSSGLDAVMGMPTRWGLGFELPVSGVPRGASTPLATSPDAFGHGGYGGQLALADPIRTVAVGFVRSHLEGGWPSAARLVDALAACL